MMVSGLVVMLGPDEPEQGQALTAIHSAPGFTVGDQNGRLLSVALETRDANESEHWHDWIAALPGVEGVEVVFVHWDDAEVIHVGA